MQDEVWVRSGRGKRKIIKGGKMQEARDTMPRPG
jgi:hypothetical protein